MQLLTCLLPDNCAGTPACAHNLEISKVLEEACSLLEVA